MFLNTLSGRFLVLTVVFVMLAEVLIFIPSVARFRQDYLINHLERAQIAALAVLASNEERVGDMLEQELLDNAGVLNVVLRRNAVRELVLSSPMPGAVWRTFDLRDPNPLVLVRDAVIRLFDAEDRVIRVLGTPARQAGSLIEVTMRTAPLRAAMIDYGVRILVLSAVISIVTASLLFLAVRRFLVAPIRRVVAHMTAYAEAPEDKRRIITPTAGIRELREAEEALRSLQVQLSAALRQKAHLAALGEAVAKISHDLRNMLTTAQLLADRMEQSRDPAVRKVAPKLVASLNRAINLCESTLAYGRAEEPAPVLAEIPLARLVADVVEAEAMAGGEAVAFRVEVPEGLVVTADPEQLFRVVQNLVRNARQAIEATGRPGTITLRADNGGGEWCLDIADTGPGLPEKARENLFAPFKGGARRGGAGLGLAIAAELARAQGGRLELVETGPAGTTFRLILPMRQAAEAA